MQQNWTGIGVLEQTVGSQGYSPYTFTINGDSLYNDRIRAGVNACYRFHNNDNTLTIVFKDIDSNSWAYNRNGNTTILGNYGWNSCAYIISSCPSNRAADVGTF